MASTEKRKSPRKKVDFPLEITLITRGNQVLSEMTKMSFKGSEISAGGLGLVTDALLREHDYLTLRFTLPGESKSLTLTGQVVGISHDKLLTAKGQLRAALKFMGIAPGDQTYLSNYIGTTFQLF